MNSVNNDRDFERRFYSKSKGTTELKNPDKNAYSQNLRVFVHLQNIGTYSGGIIIKFLN